MKASDRDSKEEALDRLLAGLRTFGFSGPIDVEDATELGSPRTLRTPGVRSSALMTVPIAAVSSVSSPEMPCEWYGSA